MDSPIYDSVLLVSYGGPERSEEVMPFLEGIVAGKRVSRDRLLAVAEHYHHFGGRSPINDQVRALRAALQEKLDFRGLKCPVYWGNRQWHPFLKETLAELASDGRRKSLAIVLAPFGCHSSCRQYLEAIEQARVDVGPTAPSIEKARLFFNHPRFIDAVASRVTEALQATSSATPSHLIFTAHSIPVSMAQAGPYETQLREACRLVAARFEPMTWELVFQSRSGPPNQPWLEPDVIAYLDREHAEGLDSFVLVPIGFVSDHMEVLYDLDVEVRAWCEEHQVEYVRAPTVGCHSSFVDCLADLVAERISGCERPAVGELACWPDRCPEDCCRLTK